MTCPESSQSWGLSQGSSLIQPSQERRMNLERGLKDMGDYTGEQAQLIHISLTTDSAKMWSESSSSST